MGENKEVETYQCLYQDVDDETKQCSYISKSDTMIGVHKRAIQGRQPRSRSRMRGRATPRRPRVSKVRL